MRSLSKALILCMIILPLGALAADGMEARILAIGGGSSVQVKRDGKELQLKTEESLKTGDELVTGSGTSVEILLSDKTLLRIGANSSYRLEERSGLNRFLHRLLKGIVRVAVPKRLKKSDEVRFEMSTPEGTIGVRGTQFVVVVEKGETRLRGHEGTVLFGGKDTDFAKPETYTQVSGGYESAIKAGEKMPSAPQPFELKKHLREIDAPSGPFGTLALRKHGMKLARKEGLRGTQDISLKTEAKPVKAPVPAGKGRGMQVRRSAGQKPTLSLGMAGRKAADDPVNVAINAVKLGDVKLFAANVNAKRFKPDIQISEEGDTLLHLSAEEGRKEIFSYLVQEHDLDVNAVNGKRQTPLMSVAMFSGDPETARFLVKNGADLARKDVGGFTALDWATFEFERRTQLAETAKKARAEELPELEKELDRWGELVNFLMEEHTKRGLPLPKELEENAGS